MKFRRPRRNEDDTSEEAYEVEVDGDASIPVSELAEEVLVRTRRILVSGEITETLSSHVCSYLQLFALMDKPIFMYINSPGGCLSSGYAIVDQMMASPCPIYTIVRGQANSMAAIITAFGNKKYRYITPNSSMMLHSVIMQHQADSIEKYQGMVDYVGRDYDQKVIELAKRTKLTTKKLKSLMKETKWLTAKDAVETGIVDGIWTPEMERNLNKAFMS